MNAAQGAASGGAAGVFGGPVGIAIGAGAGLLGSLFGAKSQTKASNTASRYEYDATMKALEQAKSDQAYTRQHDEEQQAYERSQLANNTAYSRSLGESDRAYERGEIADNKNYTRGQYANYLSRLSPYDTAGAGAVRSFASRIPGSLTATTPTMGAPVPMIQIKAPGGKVFQVPAATQQHWISKGGQVVG